MPAGKLQDLPAFPEENLPLTGVESVGGRLVLITVSSEPSSRSETNRRLKSDNTREPARGDVLERVVP